MTARNRTSLEQSGYDQWLTYVFDRPVTDPAWFFQSLKDGEVLTEVEIELDEFYFTLDSALIVAYYTRTFEECETVLTPFSDSQVALGVDYMINPSCSDDAFALLDTAVPLADRLRCIGAMSTFFEKCFAKRCSPLPFELITGSAPEGKIALSRRCYMWWDVLPLHGLAYDDPVIPDGDQLDRAIIDVLKRILTIDSLACQKSALFGLWSLSGLYPELEEIRSDFFVSHPDFKVRVP